MSLRESHLFPLIAYSYCKYSNILNNKRISTSFSVQNISTLTNVYKSYGQIKASYLLILSYLSSAIIVYYCLSNIWAVFEPQIRNGLIINNFHILHRQVEYTYHCSSLIISSYNLVNFVSVFDKIKLSSTILVSHIFSPYCRPDIFCKSNDIDNYKEVIADFIKQAQ